MAIEDLISELIAATKAQTAETQRLIGVSEKLYKLRAEAIEIVKSEAAPAEKKATPAKTSEKVADKPAADEPKANISASPEDRKDPAVETPAATDGFSDEDLKEKIKEYVAVDDADERKARAAKVKEILGKVGAKTAPEVPAEKRKAFVNTINKFLKEVEENGWLTKTAEAADDDLLG
ncbi:hypothetical protein ACFQXB_11635 [Plastorhodobacter daqingensis]|uniref:Uncharacterized protein n=1 Tax=Plastorhodobacter daqingensis TaxID=1387281 RepID=A0ABW2UJF6_9RHOB